jgi:hypothetical protein
LKKIITAFFLFAVLFSLAACATNELPKPALGTSSNLVVHNGVEARVNTMAIQQDFKSGDTLEYLKVVTLDPKTGHVIDNSIYVVQGKTPGRALADDVLGAGVIAAGGITAVKLAKPSNLVNQAYSESGASASATAGASVTTP